jgi:hypothetical protein
MAFPLLKPKDSAGFAGFGVLFREKSRLSCGQSARQPPGKITKTSMVTGSRQPFYFRTAAKKFADLRRKGRCGSSLICAQRQSTSI